MPLEKDLGLSNLLLSVFVPAWRSGGTSGARFRGPSSEDCSMLGSILGCPHSCKLPFELQNPGSLPLFGSLIAHHYITVQNDTLNPQPPHASSPFYVGMVCILRLTCLGRTGTYYCNPLSGPWMRRTRF